MNSVLLDLGLIQIRWYSALILLGLTLASILSMKETKKKGMSNDLLLDVIFYTVIIGLLGARIYYVLFNLDYYMSYPSEILQVWNGGLAIHGGIIAGLIFLKWFTKKKKYNFLLLLDIFVVGLILAQAIGRWGNFFNGEAFGRIVSLEFLKSLHLPNFIIKGMYIDGAYREPTFLYESILCFVGFIILLCLRRIKSLKTGCLTSFYLIWYGTIRLIIESLRSDSLMLGTIKIAQLVSIIAILSGIYLLWRSIKKNKNYHIDVIV
jgi:phosphatidylglycerol:prolipoprotein diacylglycerol transferase